MSEPKDPNHEIVQMVNKVCYTVLLRGWPGVIREMAKLYRLGATYEQIADRTKKIANTQFVRDNIICAAAHMNDHPETWRENTNEVRN